MKKIKRLKLSKKAYVKNSELLPQLYAKQCELIDFANKHQEEHEGLLDAIKTVYAPEIEGKIFSSGRGTDQPEETKAEKIFTQCECCAEAGDCVEVNGLYLCSDCIDEFAEEFNSNS